MTTLEVPGITEYVARVEKLRPVIEAHAGWAEQHSRPADAVVDAFHEARLFRMLLPSAVGGAGLSSWEIAPILEAAARIDGSAGWTLALGQGLIALLLPPHRLHEIYANPRALIVGSLNPVQSRAVAVDGGFSFTGKGTYVSNGTHSSHMLAAALVFEGGKPRFVNGAPVILAGVMPMAECKVLDTWAMTGMRGTGSHDVAFDQVFVPEDLTFPLGDALANLGGQLTPVALGIAQHAIDAFVELASTKVPTGSRSALKERVTAQDQLGRAAGLLQAGRAAFYETAHESRQREETGAAADAHARARQRLGTVMGAQLAAEAVGLIFDAAGMTGAAQSCAIERCWRDVNVVRQHITLATTRYEVVGRVLLGMEPGSPLI